MNKACGMVEALALPIDWVFLHGRPNELRTAQWDEQGATTCSCLSRLSMSMGNRNIKSMLFPGTINMNEAHAK